MESLDVAVQRWPDARRVCVIGAGTMGSGIAAHLANLGFHVSLLDVTEKAAFAGLDRVQRGKPPHFYVPESAARIEAGALDDHRSWIAQADWVVEAIVENLEAKRSLFDRVEPLLRDDAMVSTNTSGLQIALLAEGRSESFRRRFLGTHFFNPPRYLKLLELIPTPDTDPGALAAMTRFLEDKVARRVVPAKDTPGFIANRFGMWAMFHAVRTAEKLQLTIEEVDAITGPFLGRPRSASFRLNDIVGLDIMRDIAANLVERCPDDPHREALATPRSMATLLERGWIGEKSGQGYYRREGREFLSLDLVTHAYRERREPDFPALKELGRKPLAERIAAALELRDPVGEFLRHHLVPVLRYADYLKAEVSHSVLDFDRVMQWGFGWEMGPFATIDAIGAENLGIEPESFFRGSEVRTFTGSYTERPNEPQYVTVEQCPIVKACDGFNVRDLGDGVLALTTTTKMGVFSPFLVDAMLAEIEAGHRGPLVLTCEGKHFSAGFDLKFILECIDAADWARLDAGLVRFQRLGEDLAARGVVAAVQGFCLGGGYEMATACARVVAGPESTIGLPEAKVGLVPSGGGLARLRARLQHDAKSLAEMAVRLSMGTTATNADEARKLGFLRETDVVEYHPDRVLFTAKNLAVSVGPNLEPAYALVPPMVVGMIDRGQEKHRQAGDMSEHDEHIGDRIKAVLVKSTSFATALEAERAEFLSLCGRALSVARVRHMVETGKPLRN
ncbi:MAG: 3-hydroxyacyl-CoA dehydrogenase/enoyl-CoA hydratase family protein [Fimbriimonadaceae bacterium]|nr:3-hydroxyacyl-CoA dehydrogenase/enoyl-CoA hydratase family protein [Fimbriimonadaceae bacterium]